MYIIIIILVCGLYIISRFKLYSNLIILMFLYPNIILISPVKLKKRYICECQNYSYFINHSVCSYTSSLIEWKINENKCTSNCI